ncbi:hypothetical protein [Staphylococcus phage vB_StaM_PB50]|nr:hypothetical protein [Staphylococcus phage vB_StaM_PB50]
MSNENNGIDLISQINDMMEEYKMLVGFKSKMERKEIQLEERIRDLTKNLKYPKHTFVSNMEANIISVEKEIKDTIMQMKNVKKDIIDLTMKAQKMAEDDESEDNYKVLAKNVLSQLNNMSNKDILNSMTENEEDTAEDEEDLKDKLDQTLENLNKDIDEDEKEIEKREELQKEVNELKYQDLASILKVYKGTLQFFVLGDTPNEYELVIADNEMNIIEEDELEDEYPELFTMTRDLIFEDIEGNDEIVKDEFGNIYQKAEF